MDDVYPAASRSQSTCRKPASRAICAAAVAGILMGLTGCQGEEIDTAYGMRSGYFGEESVNGTAVLARMFEQAGHRVITKRVLTDALRENSDVIVWVPNDFEPPSEEHVRWLDRWLWQDGRTLIYVGRDFDAAPKYYDKVIPTAPLGGQVNELKRRRSEAQSDYTSERAILGTTADCGWFRIDNTGKPRSVTSLAGPWSDGVDATKVEIELQSRLQPRQYVSTFDPEYQYYDLYDQQYDMESEDEAESDDTVESVDEASDIESLLPTESDQVLLRSNGDILVSRQPYNDETDSHLVLVANGSFLLNMQLVNREHRKLAQNLVDLLETPQTVVFVESGPGGPRIMAKEPSQDIPTGLNLLAKRPLDVILFHVALLGVIFCLSRWPVFGRPRQGRRESASDFGKHVEALGELLERTGDEQFARRSIEQYHHAQAAESASGVPGSPAGKGP